jgi:signal transduction histidine kinase
VFVRLALVMAAETTTVGTENPLFVWRAPEVHDRLLNVGDAVATVYLLAAFAILTRRWLTASSAGRHLYAPVLGAALFFIVALGFEEAGARLIGPGPSWPGLPAVVARIVIPLAFLYGLLRSRVERSGVGDLVIELGTQPREPLREALARTLHDPTLELAYWDPGRAVYINAFNELYALPDEGSRQVATTVGRGGQRLAAIIHDRALLDDPRLLETVAATAGLLLENERLQAELRAQLAELRASRERIVRSGDEERRRLERDLHDGAQQRLLGLGMGLELIRARVEPSSDTAQLVEELEIELGRALQELRELARGINPAVLTEQGLPAAVRALAERSPVPVGVTVPDEPFPSTVETAAYFVIAESLSNVAKYAHARRAWVSVATENGSARVEVRDDGVGGAEPADGSGLQGLADRVGALGGQLRVESPPGGGTTVIAELPCA